MFPSAFVVFTLLACLVRAALGCADDDAGFAELQPLLVAVLGEKDETLHATSCVQAGPYCELLGGRVAYTCQHACGCPCIDDDKHFGMIQPFLVAALNARNETAKPTSCAQAVPYCNDFSMLAKVCHKSCGCLRNDVTTNTSDCVDNENAFGQLQPFLAEALQEAEVVAQVTHCAEAREYCDFLGGRVSDVCAGTCHCSVADGNPTMQPELGVNRCWGHTERMCRKRRRCKYVVPQVEEVFFRFDLDGSRKLNYTELVNSIAFFADMTGFLPLIKRNLHRTALNELIRLMNYFARVRFPYITAGETLQREMKKAHRGNDVTRNELIRVLELFGGLFENLGECRTKEDLCTIAFGDDATMCAAQWLFPGCCFVGGRGCVTYTDFLPSCEVPQNTVGVSGLLTLRIVELAGWSPEDAPAASLAVRGTLAELANVGIAMAHVEVDPDSTKQEFTVKYTVHLPQSRSVAEFVLALGKVSIEEVMSTATKHLRARRLSYTVEVGSMTIFENALTDATLQEKVESVAGSGWEDLEDFLASGSTARAVSVIALVPLAAWLGL